MTDIASLGLAVDSTQVKDAKKALDDMATAGGKAEQSTKAMAAATNVLSGFVRRLAEAYAGLKIAQYVKDATLLNARYETLGVAMRVVGANAGYTAEQMEAAAVGLQKTGITMVESRQQILRLVSAQIDLAKASDLARIAQDAAVIGNMNSSAAFAHLIFGISSAQPEVLRTIGLNVSMEKSYAEMAKTLGVTVGQLTQAQRTQAVLNSVMREGKGIAGVYEAAMSTAGKQLNSMQRYVENLKLTLGETFNEALVIAVEATTAGLKSMGKEADELSTKGKLREWGRDAIMIAAQIVDGLRLVINSFIQTGKEIVMVAEITKLALKGQFSAIKDVVSARNSERDSFLQNLNLMQRTAAERFALVDKERENVKVTEVATRATTENAQAVATNTKENTKAETAYKTVIRAIREKIAIQELELQMGKSLTDAQATAVDAMVKLRDGTLQLSEAKKIELTTELERLASVEKSVMAMEFSKTASDTLISSSQSQVVSMREQVEAGRQNLNMMGKTNAQILQLTGAKNMELAANLRAAAQYAGPLHSAYIRHANDLEALAKMQKELVSQKQIADVAQDWQRIGTSIEQTGRMAFVQFAAHGVNAMKSIGEAIKLSIFDAIYQITVRKWVIQLTTSFTGSLVSGAANAATGGIGGNLFSTAGGFVKAISEGVSSGMGSVVSGIGSVFNSSLMSAFGSGMGMSGSAAAGAAGAYGAAGMGGVGSALSLGSMAGAAVPFVGAALAAGSLTSAFGSGKKIFGIDGDSPLNFIAPIIGILAGLFGKGPKKLGPSELTGDFLSDGFHGEFQADWTRKVGLFGGKKRGRRGLGIEPEQLDAVNDTLFSITDSMQGFVSSMGEGKRSLDGWSFTVKSQLDTDEQRKQLALDLTDSLAEKLIPEVVALKGEEEDLATAMGRLKAEFSLTSSLIDLTGQSFGATGLASLALRDNLIQLMGGLQNADSQLKSFFESFYTDEERTASATRLLNAEFAKLGVSMPNTKDQYRALVEAQNLSTESGREMFAALVKLSPVFASITDAAGKAADDMEAEAERIKNSFKVLSTDSFKTLFEYNKYIQLARNAGITAAQPENVFDKGASQEQYFYPSLAVGTNSLPGDMTINAHKGERIIPAADNSRLMSALSGRNEDLKAILVQLQKLREEGRAHALALAKNTSKSAKALDQMSIDGIRIAE